MTPNKMYRISLKNDFSYLTNTLVLLAAKSNGGDYKSILELKAIAEVLQLTHPEYIVDQIGENILHIDYKKGKDYLHALSLEEVEVMELDMPQVSAQEAREILDELSGVPTIDRYLGTGITDENNLELLN